LLYWFHLCTVNNIDEDYFNFMALIVLLDHLLLSCTLFLGGTCLRLLELLFVESWQLPDIDVFDVESATEESLVNQRRLRWHLVLLWLLCQTEHRRVEVLVSDENEPLAAISKSSLYQVNFTYHVCVINDDCIERIIWVLLHVLIEDALIRTRRQQCIDRSDHYVSISQDFGPSFAFFQLGSERGIPILVKGLDFGQAVKGVFLVQVCSMLTVCQSHHFGR